MSDDSAAVRVAVDRMWEKVFRTAEERAWPWEYLEHEIAYEATAPAIAHFEKAARCWAKHQEARDLETLQTAAGAVCAAFLLGYGMWKANGCPVREKHEKPIYRVKVFCGGKELDGLEAAARFLGTYARDVEN